jgi:hypothetical protein
MSRRHREYQWFFLKAFRKFYMITLVEITKIEYIETGDETNRYTQGTDYEIFESKELAEQYVEYCKLNVLPHSFPGGYNLSRRDYRIRELELRDKFWTEKICSHKIEWK